MTEFLRSTTLLPVLLNPFLVIMYLIDMIETLDRRQFAKVMLRAGVIASTVFVCFALLGDAVFSRLMHTEFPSFHIFGGVVFLLVGRRFGFEGPKAIEILRGKSEHLAGAVAMPVLIGPATISASVVISKRLEPLLASAAVVCAVAISIAISIAIMIALNAIHDNFRPRRERHVQRYVEVVGRVLPLFVGTIAIAMNMQGVRAWVEKF